MACVTKTFWVLVTSEKRLQNVRTPPFRPFRKSIFLKFGPIFVGRSGLIFSDSNSYCNFSKFVRLKKEYYKLVRSSIQISSPFKSVKTGEKIRVIRTVRNLPNNYSSLCHTGPWCKDVFLPRFTSELKIGILFTFLSVES
jgi:hypothetical protein